MSPCLAEAKSMKPEPGEVTSPPHSSSKKEDGLKRERESQDMNDSDEEDDDEDEDADMLEEEEVRLHPVSTQIADAGSLRFHESSLLTRYR